MPSRRARVAVALAVGSVAAAFAVGTAAAVPGILTDFDAVWVGARALAAGVNPYALSRATLRNAFGLYYPVPALLVALPVAWLPLVAARAAFMGVSGALLAWAVTRDGWARLPMFTSLAYLHAAVIVQWSPLLLAATLLPIGGILLAKPNLGVAFAVARLLDPRPDRRRWVAWGAASGVALLVAGWCLLPGWVPAWLGALAATGHITAPILRPGGVLLALALLRWRRPESRLLLALACVPQTPGVVEGLPLFLLVRSPREGLWLSVLTYVAHIAAGLLWRAFPDSTLPEAGFYYWSGIATLACLYLPALVMVLRRPNEGAGRHAGQAPFRRPLV